MAWIAGRSEKHQIACLQLRPIDRPSDFCLCCGGPRQIDFKYIFINCLYKAGTIDTTVAVAAKTVLGSLPPLVFGFQLLLDFWVAVFRLTPVRLAGIAEAGITVILRMCAGQEENQYAGGQD